MKMTSPRWWGWQHQRGNGESFCVVLEKMEVGVFRSCLQRPKSVIFEGLVMRVLSWCWWRMEKEDGEEEEKESFLRERILESEYEFEK